MSLAMLETFCERLFLLIENSAVSKLINCVIYVYQQVAQIPAIMERTVLHLAIRTVWRVGVTS